ncbi:SURF1 family protein [Cupriavidus sp. JZ107]
MLALLAVVAFAGLFALGTWQVERRAWKFDLIERVEARVHAPPVDAPAPERWPLVSAAADEYRHVRVTGTFLHDRETLVQATTALGGGFWVMTPMRMRDGTVVLINRGFVPQEFRAGESRADNEPSGETTVTGLLRITQTGGGFLRSNDPAADLWYSRDVQAIAAARGLERVAPYFIDADGDAQQAPAASGAPRRWPVGGLTVVTFHNSHLVYALTWYGLALMVLGAAWYVGRDELRLRRGH